LGEAVFFFISGSRERKADGIPEKLRKVYIFTRTNSNIVRKHRSVKNMRMYECEHEDVVSYYTGHKYIVECQDCGAGGEITSCEVCDCKGYYADIDEFDTEVILNDGDTEYYPITQGESWQYCSRCWERYGYWIDHYPVGYGVMSVSLYVALERHRRRVERRKNSGHEELLALMEGGEM